jgi:carbon-monoxide dehydrogenase medium subunit
VLALEAEIRLQSAAGVRTIRAEDFFLDLMTTAIKPGEILTQVSFVPIPTGAGFAYLKHRQPPSGFTIVGSAALVTLDRRGNCDQARVGITRLGAKAFRVRSVEAALAGKAPDTATIIAATAHATDGVDPLSDIHASADFRGACARLHAARARKSPGAHPRVRSGLKFG